MVDVAMSLTDEGNRPDRDIPRGLAQWATPQEPRRRSPAGGDPRHLRLGREPRRGPRERVAHLTSVATATGNWRPAMDGLRFQASAIWERLTEEDREEFLATDAGAWNVLRHRMAPSSAVLLRELHTAGRMTVDSGSVAEVSSLPRGGLRVPSNGTVREVGWVVNCTGPLTDVRELGDPFIDDLLRHRGGASLAVASTAGHGRAHQDGRLIGADGTHATRRCGPWRMRRGELWESTAIPEIRTQSLAVATRRARRRRAAAPSPGRWPAGQRAPPRRPPSRSTRAAHLDDSRSGSRLQRGTRASHAPAVRR